MTVVDHTELPEFKYGADRFRYLPYRKGGLIAWNFPEQVENESYFMAEDWLAKKKYPAAKPRGDWGDMATMSLAPVGTVEELEAFLAGGDINAIKASSRNTILRRAARRLVEIERQGRKRLGDEKQRFRDLGLAMKELEAIAAALPLEIRSKLGGFPSLSTKRTAEAREKYLDEKRKKASALLDGHLQKAAVTRLQEILKDHLPSKNKRGVLASDIGVIASDYLKAVKAVWKDSVDDAQQKITDAWDLLEKATDPDEINRLTEEWEILSNFSAFGKEKMGRKWDGMWESILDLEHLIAHGKTLRQVEEEAFAAQVREKAAVIQKAWSGGKGVKDISDKNTGRKERQGWVARHLIGPAEYHMKNLGMEWFLNLLDRGSSDTGTLQGPGVKMLQPIIHRATHAEKRAQRARGVELNHFLADVFGAKAFSKALDDRLYTFTHDIVSDTGVFWTKRDKETLSMTVVEARNLLATPALQGQYSATELEDITDRVAEYDASTRKGKAPARDKVSVERILSEEVKELPLTLDQAVYLYQLSQQESYTGTLPAQGIDDTTIAQLVDFIDRSGPEGMQIYDWLRNQYDDSYGPINSVYKKIFGVNMPRNDNYAPASFETFEEVVDDLMDGSYASSTMDWGNIKQRQRHNAEPKLDDGAIALYNKHIVQAEHFKAWALPMKMLRGVLSNKATQSIVKHYHGTAAHRLLNQKLNDLADGGRKGADALGWLDRMRYAYTVAALAYKVGITVKQLTSFPAYGMNMPLKEFARYEAQFLKSPIESWNKIASLPYVKDRFLTGNERDLMAVMGLHTDKPKSMLRRGAEYGMIATRVGDIIPVIISGYAAHQYAYAQAKADGLSDVQAEEAGELAFEMASDRTQQAGNVKDLTEFQSRGSLYRFLTMFKTSPVQYYANTYEAMLDWRAGRAGSGADFAKRAVIAHIVLPVLFQFATDLMRHGLPDPDEDDWELKNYARAIVTGPLNGLFIASDVIAVITNAFSTQNYFMNNLAPPVAQEGEKVGRNLLKLKNSDMGDEDFQEAAFEILESLSRLGLLGDGGWTAILAPKYRRTVDILED